MRKSISLLLVSALMLSACGSLRDTRLNPFNWFGRGESRQIDATEERNPLIPRRNMLAAREVEDRRRPIQQVTLLVIEREPSGAIVRAEGVTARQGAHDLALRPVEDESVPEGTLRYAFVAYQPSKTAIGTAESRKVVAAVHLSNRDLAEVRRIEVVGTSNVMTARR